MLICILSFSLLSFSFSTDNNLILKALHSKSLFSSLLSTHLQYFHQSYSQKELPLRARFFRKNLEQVAACNDHNNFHCDINKFSTMSPDERGRYLGLGNVTETPRQAGTQPRRLTALSASGKDWRDLNAVTPVKDQESCGSCWAFAATASIEGTYAITVGKLKSFSDQELLECTYEQFSNYDGCGGGWMYDAFTFLKKHQHLSSERTLPYTAHDGRCRRSYQNSMAAAEVTGYVKTNPDDYSLAAAIDITPVSVAMLAAGNFFSYSNGIYDGYEDCYGATWPNHALTAVAFTADSFVIKNSWGNTWGDAGYITIARGRNVCFVNDNGYYPTMKQIGDDTDTDPTEDTPPHDDCKEQEYDENCVDVNERDCPNIRHEGQCFENYMISYTERYCAKSCGFCNNIPLADLANDCVQRMGDYGCGDWLTELVCPKSCCTKDDGNDDGDDDGCPAGTSRCPDGSCKHIHMC